MASVGANALLDITTAWAVGTKLDDLPRQVHELLSSLDAEALVEVFKILPRPLAQPHLDKFLDAEKARDVSTVSKQLLLTNFADCGPVDGNLFRIISTAINHLKAETPNVFEWRQKLCKMAAKAPNAPQLDLDAHARAAIVYALNSPTFLAFESLLDSVSGVKTTKPETANLIAFIDTVLLTGAGAKGYADFVKKHGAKFFEALEVHGALSKARLLSLCAVLNGKTEVSLAELAQVLDVKDAMEAESIVVDASTANIIDVQVDPLSQVVCVKSVMPLRFDKKAFEELKRHIESTIAFVESLEKTYQVPATH